MTAKSKICQTIHIGGRETPGRLLAATPIVKQPMTRPYRVVLVDKGNEYVVWEEYFADGEVDEVDDQNGHYDRGQYFKPEEFPDALKAFAKRCEEFAYCCESTLRVY